MKALVPLKRRLDRAGGEEDEAERPDHIILP
jgi:hypothetical protein